MCWLIRSSEVFLVSRKLEQAIWILPFEFRGFCPMFPGLIFDLEVRISLSTSEFVVSGVVGDDKCCVLPNISE